MTRENIQVLRKMLKSDRGVILPGAPNALAARVIADLGFCAIYLSGAGHRESCGDMGFPLSCTQTRPFKECFSGCRRLSGRCARGVC
jgi:2-methylisocitrate lyase-like PEP mutase family enzyme